jgi:hypothetical protein
MISKRVIMLLVFAMFVAGCASNGPTSGTTPYCDGIDALQLDFQEGSPPTEVLDNNQYPFDVTLRLLNKGEYNIEPQDARIELSGISSVDFGGPAYQKNVADRIPGKQKDQDGKCPEASPQTVSFGSLSETQFKYSRTIPGNTQFTVRADLCYKYKSFAAIQFCVQKELPRFGLEPICKVTETKKVSNSASPVHIENFKQYPGQNKVAFNFDIVHKGTGSIHAGTLCNTEFTNRNKVRVKVTSAVGALQCSTLNGANEGDVILNDDGKALVRTVNCVMVLDSVSDSKAFETPLNVELQYNYKQHKDTNILVKHLG